MTRFTRRDLLTAGAAFGGAAWLSRHAGAQPHQHDHDASPAPAHEDHVMHDVREVPTPPPPQYMEEDSEVARRLRAAGHTPVIAPDVPSLPWKEVGGVKVFHLVAQPVPRQFAPGLDVHCWGYNGVTPGPLIQVVQGDRCRFYVTNELREVTTMHWHGVLLPSGMDGVGGLNQPAIEPGQTFVYEFTFNEAGTFMYHPHYDEMTQIALGMHGMIVVHPRRPQRNRRLRDYAIMLHEWDIPIGTARPNPLAMTEFNVLTMNGKAFPGTTPLVAETGDTLRVRLGNLSPMEHHPIHLHGHSFRIVETDGGQVSRSAQVPETTVLVPVGSARVIETRARPGDWAMHCHMTHHIMNQMGHEAPNLIGVNTAGLDRKIRQLVPGYMTMGEDGMAVMAKMDMPFPRNSIPMLGGRGPYGIIDMGGMFTIVKVRDRLPASAAEVGWYDPPPGTLAHAATAEERARDGIDG